MNLDRFLRTREPGWSELGTLLADAHTRPERLGPERLQRLGGLYRAAAADLALARRSFPGDPVVRRLEDLVARGRTAVYGAATSRESVRSFLGTGYWRRIRERPVPLLISALLLIGPLALATGWALADPAAAAGVVPAAFQQGEGDVGRGSGRESADLGLSLDDSTAFSAQIFTNNIRVTFLAFAGGISAGILTAISLLYNGMVIGVVTGLSIDAGETNRFVQLIVPHGVLELSCIVVAGAAGLRMGWALVDPGRISRGAALAAEARKAAELALGTAPWLVLAGIVEGFVTPSGLGAPGAVAVGFALGIAYWALVLIRGRSGVGSPP